MRPAESGQFHELPRLRRPARPHVAGHPTPNPQPRTPQPGIGPGPAPAGSRLAVSIIVCILCCWPLAIPAIVYAAQAISHNGQRNYAEAHEAARKSMNWSMIAISVTFLITAGWFIFAFVMQIP